MQPPLVVGGTGGSGTRVAADMLRHMGVFMGTHLNDALDALEWVASLDTWVPRFLEQQSRMPDATFDAMAAELRACAERHRATLPDADAAWGWKNPRSIYLLPVFDALYPGMRFLHVVRDGRDMAFSRNQNQTTLYAPLLVGSRAADPLPVQAAALWSKVNAGAARYGARRMGARYLWVRFEDLCAHRADTLQQLCAFAAPGFTDVAALHALASTPPSVGRWREQAPEAIAAVETAGRDGLHAFGYAAPAAA